MDNRRPGFGDFRKKKKKETEDERFARQWKWFVIAAVSIWAIYEFVIKPVMEGTI